MKTKQIREGNNTEWQVFVWSMWYVAVIAGHDRNGSKFNIGCDFNTKCMDFRLENASFQGQGEVTAYI